MTQHIETTKHTPGPWHVNPIRPTAGTSILDSKSDLVASAFNKPSPESEANARLIAAAPELLVELQKALAYMEADSDDEQERIDYASAKTTITKATQQ